MSSQNLPTKVSSANAALRTISYKDLQDGDIAAREELTRACLECGFFYLDCNSHRNGKTVQEIDQLFEVEKQTYDLPLEEKRKWAADKDHGGDMVLGYKESGHGQGPLEGKKDGFEGIMIFEHALNQWDMSKPLNGPQPLQEQQQFVKKNITSMNDMGQAVFTSLSKTLGLSGKDSFEYSHRPGVASTTALGLLKYEPYVAETSEKVGHIAHTDAGSLSIVWSTVGGLQVLLPDTDEWTFIAPRPGMAIVNVGDSLQFLSQGLLRSSLHRVVPHPDESHRTKYTIVYLMRPEEEAQITDRDGKVWRAVDWTNKKFAVFRASIEEQKKGSFLTGRDGYLGLWDRESKSSSRAVEV